MPSVADEAELLASAEQAGGLSRFKTYLRLSGPGWLQSAITLGGGSLSGSLYLGVVAGVGLLWVQPVAMLLGIAVLSAIGAVTLHTGRRPLEVINQQVNPVLGWAWALAALVASIVWALPQYALAVGVIEQNLLPQLSGAAEGRPSTALRVVVALVILAVSTMITWSYGRGLRGVRLYERALKLLVGLIVLCFCGVAARLLSVPGALDLGAVLGGFVPDLSMAFEPAPRLRPLLDAVSPEHRAYWSDLLVTRQRDVMIASAAVAVGINMTFLFPYSLLKRGWGRAHVGLSRFDLLTGMLIPFTIASSLVVVAAASQFHALAPPGLPPVEGAAEQAGQLASARHLAQYQGLLKGLSQHAGEAAAAMGSADQQLAAALVTRDAFDLAKALQPLMGSFFSQVVFGLGVLGMTLSTISLLMLISGMVVCELMGRPVGGQAFKFGSMAAAFGALGPFVWSKAAFWLAVPTSIFGFILMPIACIAFLLLINRRSVMGDAMPKGRARLAWNAAVGAAAVVFAPVSVIMTWNKGGVWGIAALSAFVLAVAVGEVWRRRNGSAEQPPVGSVEPVPNLD